MDHCCLPLAALVDRWGIVGFVVGNTCVYGSHTDRFLGYPWDCYRAGCRCDAGSQLTSRKDSSTTIVRRSNDRDRGMDCSGHPPTTTSHAGPPLRSTLLGAKRGCWQQVVTSSKSSTCGIGFGSCWVALGYRVLLKGMCSVPPLSIDLA